jgi:membrane protein insertase Oxa1/YidC/SpoIIIJ
LLSERSNAHLTQQTAPPSAVPTLAAAAPVVAATAATSNAAAAQITDAQLEQQLREALTQSVAKANEAPLAGVKDDSFFATPYIDPANHPVLQWTIDALTYMHDTTGLPWYATLFLAGLGARLLLAPLQIYQARIAAGMAGLEPYFIVLDQKVAALPKEQRTVRMTMHAAGVKWNLYQRHGCNPWKLLPPTLVQVGVFVTMAIALRSMVYTTPALLTGGALWFENLAAMDPHYILPLTAILSSYAASLAMEWFRTRDGKRMRAQAMAALSVSAPKAPAPATLAEAKQKTTVAASTAAPSSPAASTSAPSSSTPPTAAPATPSPPVPVSHLHDLQHYLRGLSLLAIPWVVHMPCGIFFFWFAGTLWTHASAMGLRHPKIRERLGLTELETVFQRKTAEAMLAKSNAAAASAAPIVVVDKRVLPTTLERYAAKPATSTQKAKRSG